MSIELPQYTIQAKTEERTKIKKGLLPVAIVLSLAAGYFSSGLYANNTINTLQIRNYVLETINAQNQDKLVQLETTISLLKTEQKVRQEAISQVQNDYKSLIDNQNQLKSEINFYERLLSPNVENKGLRIFDVTANKSSNDYFSIKVILVQKIERAKEISGKFEIALTGRQNNENKSINISVKEDSNYQFKYFHHISLGFSMPEGFKAEQLVVKLIPNNKKAKTIEHTVEWHSIIKEDKNNV